MISDWKECFWGDIATLEYGKSLRDYRDKKGPYPVYGTNGLIGSHTEPLCTNPGVIIGRKGAYRGVHYSPNPFYVIDTAFYLKPKIKDLDLLFAYYELLTHDINSMDSGSAIPSTSREDFYNLPLRLPPIEEQLAISKLLNKFDEKIELNQDMNRTLEAIGQAIFRHWFVHFEFPDGEGRPYKSSGGEMVDSELGEIPKGWEVGKFGKIVDNFDKKRIPLSKKQRESRKGQYPYYGATSIMDYVDDFLFDGTYVLMAEDGSVIDDGEKPVLQYVWGKFWVNNHAHVLKGQNGISDEFIYLLLKNTNIKHLVTGAVQLKINQKNMNNLQVVIPDLDILSKFSEIIKPLFAKYRVCSDENETLSQLRDSLLPKLMSGKIRVNISEEATAK